MEKDNNKDLINESAAIKVIDITDKLDKYVTLDEFMRRTAFMEDESMIEESLSDFIESN